MEAPVRLDRGPRTGIGFRAPHFAEFVATHPPVGFLEIHAENYLGGGPSCRQLDALRADYPISIHGVGLSLGGAAGIDPDHLARFAGLVERIEPALVSEHLAWSNDGGVYLNDLLPLPYTEESLAVVTANVLRVQDRIRRPILVENPAAYLHFAHSTLTEAAFLAELNARTGCGLLLDINNIHVSCCNVGGDPNDWFDALTGAMVGEIHLAGHARNDADGTVILIDDHGSPVAAPVWDLYEDALRRFPKSPTLVEWDSNLPALPVLLAEAEKADRRRRHSLTELSYADAA